ncbi:hypothetical protein NKH80_28975 [Mesorhizobium sp. M0904]|uniref:hypothetical protein n=1 Tax=Mesorhizobium sp. M0904 TaxID=2957022 RepID=UPI003336C806
MISNQIHCQIEGGKFASAGGILPILDEVSMCALGTATWLFAQTGLLSGKRIIGVVLREVVAHVEGDQIHLLLHWQGGDHTRLTVRKDRRGQTRYRADPGLRATDARQGHCRTTQPGRKVDRSIE